MEIYFNSSSLGKQIKISEVKSLPPNEIDPLHTELLCVIGELGAFVNSDFSVPAGESHREHITNVQRAKTKLRTAIVFREKLALLLSPAKVERSIAKQQNYFNLLLQGQFLSALLSEGFDETDSSNILAECFKNAADKYNLWILESGHERFFDPLKNP
jgi:hypothetical protein